MSGSTFSTGMLTDEGNNILVIGNDFDHKIKDLVIHNIPLSTNNTMTALKAIGKFVSPLVHSALTPTLSHIIIQLNLEDSDFVYLIEYGQYFPTNNSNESRDSANSFDYYYINKDGARITRISYIQIDSNESQAISKIIARKCFGENIQFDNISNNFYRVECDIKNKKTLRELCNNFKSGNWSAENFEVATHNSQTFAAEIIKFLKAVRKHEYDKIRKNEKLALPNCLIKALWNNEDLSVTNTLGRIPIFGLFHDLVKNAIEQKK